MKKQLDLYSKNNKKFQMEGLKSNDIEEISVITPGYIILPNGDYVTIGHDRHHKDVFEEYLNKYLETDIEIQDTISAVEKLNEEGHVVYCGTRVGHFNSSHSGSVKSRGFVFTPELNITTDLQLTSIANLLKTNVSAISKNIILDIVFGDTKNKAEYNEFEFLDLIQANKKNK
jgi:hypothetical protein